MEIVLIILAFITCLAIFLFIVWFKNSSKKEVEPLSTKKSEISYLPLQKNNTQSLKSEDAEFVLNIQSISKLLDHIEFVVELKNNSDRYIKIEFQKVILIQGNEISYSGDYSYLDFMMGTNDLILKNTVLSGMSLIRNIKFEEFDYTTIKGDNQIIIDIIINDKLYNLSTTINDSEVAEIKVVKLVDM